MNGELRAFPGMTQKAKVFWETNDSMKGIAALHICGTNSNMYLLWFKGYNTHKAQESKRKISAFWQTMASINLKWNGSSLDISQKKQKCTNVYLPKSFKVSGQKVLKME